MRLSAALLCLAIAAQPSVAAPADSVRIEYIAHAAFVITSPAGTRIAIDPFNGKTWLGYSFPKGVEANAVLVSHPHYDHDATYYFDNETPVFRSANGLTIGDIAIRGIATEHLGRARFLDRGQIPLNTVWVLETGGLRIAHLGDSRPLNGLDLEAMGPVDIILIGASYFEAPNAEMLELLLEAAQPTVMIPMHYRHDEMTELPRGMKSVAEVLEGRDFEPFPVDGNVADFDPGDLSGWARVVVLQPSPGIEPWPETLHEAWVQANEGGVLLAEAEEEAQTDPVHANDVYWEALASYEAAMDLAPGVLKFGYGAGRALAGIGEANDAIETLDHAISRAPQGDWTDRARVHMLLGELYEAGGRPDIAIYHYEMVASQVHTYETLLRERALQRLQELR